MVAKQKKFTKSLLLSLSGIAFVLGVFVATLIVTNTVTTSNVSAVNGCPGEETPGADNKCFLNGQPTANTVDPNATSGNPDDPGTTGEETADEETCAIDKIGWILCPIIEQAAHISDKAFKILSDNFLRTDPQLFSNDSGTKTAWEYARNLANIMFIIAFLWIILSQVTGRGLDNYGIKKMLPRLIIAAVAVNVSYYICQIAVDITNILGYEIQNALADISNSLGPSVLGDASKFGADDKGGGVLTVIAVGALATAGVVFLILAPLGSIILFILITILTIIVILLLRKALIVLLIVISPIAFVLYLLPNTEKFFSKWMSMFGKLLMVFPIVGLLFGAGQLASTIIIVSGAQSEEAVKQAEECNPDAEKKDGKYEDEATEKYYNDQRDGSYNTCGGGAVTLNTTKDGEETDARTVSWMLGLVAAGIAVAPLIGVWAVLKGALSATGAIGGKITNAVSKGVAGGANGAAGWAGRNTAIGRGINARKAIKQNYKDQKFANRMSSSGKRGALTRIAARGVSGNVGRIPGVNGVFGAYDDKLSANFAGAAAKIDEQEATDKKALYRNALRQDPTQDATEYLYGQMKHAVQNGDLASARAAEEMLLEQGKGGVNKVRQLFHEVDAGSVKADQKTYSQLAQHITQTQNSLKGSDADVYSYASSYGTSNQDTIENIRSSSKAFDGITNEQMAGQSAFALGNAEFKDANGNVIATLGANGAQQALGKPQTVVSFDSNGRQVVQQVDRKHAILNSDAAKIIKAENMHHFN